MLIPYSKDPKKLPHFVKLICANDFSKYTAVGKDIEGVLWAPPVEKGGIVPLEKGQEPVEAIVNGFFTEELLEKFLKTNKPFLMLDVDTNTVGYYPGHKFKIDLQAKKIFQADSKQFGIKVTLQKFSDFCNPSVDVNVKLDFIEWWWKQYKKFIDNATFDHLSAYLNSLAKEPPLKLKPKYAWVLKNNVLTHTEV